MPGQANQAAGAASSDTDASDGAAGGAIGGMAAAATPPVPPSPSAGPVVPPAATPAADAQSAVQNSALAQLGAAALLSTAPGSRPRPTANTSSDSTPPSTVDTTAVPTAPAASVQSDIGALADVQHLISGLSAGSASDDSDTDTDAAAAPAATHAATPAGSADAAQAAAALQASSASRPGSGLGPTTLTIHAPVSSPAFTNEVTAQVSSLAQAGITQAQLHLNPTDMGPVQVHITLQAGQASVWFGANHADTRAALEQSLPRLREMFAGAGMPLTDSGVFREPPRQTPGQPASATTSSRDADAAVAPASTVTQVSNIRLSLLDTYA